MGRYRKGRKRHLRGPGTRLMALRSSGSSSKKQFRKRRKSKVLVMVLLFAGVLGMLLLLANAAFDEEQTATVVVEEGDTLSSVADKLEEAGVISSPALFKLSVRVRGGETEIKPGEYRFEVGDGSDKILQTLASGDSISAFEITVPEGLTLEQTAQRVEEQSGVPAAEFEAAARSTDYPYAFLDDPAIKTTEGFLFPKKYEFERAMSASQIVDRFLEQYSVETRELNLSEAESRFGLSEYEIITVASLIEKEAANPEERPLVASVIYNRLWAEMPLQIDATIQYARGKPKEELSLDDLEVDSPYNTYRNTGLPPGPIASPSQESIQAALEPAQTEYLYYVLKADGVDHFFTDDYDEFLSSKQERDAQLTVTP